MRWLKHMSRARNDSRMAQLLDECGPEGYGIYWLIAEIIAEQLEVGGYPSVTYSLPQWSRVLYSHHHRVSNYLGKLQVIGLCEVSEVGGKIKVSLPKLLKYKDEWSRKSGVTPESVGSDSGHRSEENRTEKSREEQNRPKPADAPDGAMSVPTPLPPTGPAHVAAPAEEKRPITGTSSPGDTEFDLWFDQTFWPLYPRKDAKSACKTAARKKLKTEADRYTAMARLAHDRAEWLLRPPDKRPHGTTWFNQNRWSDPIEADQLALVPLNGAHSDIRTYAERNEEVRNRKFMERMAEELVQHE